MDGISTFPELLVKLGLFHLYSSTPNISNFDSTQEFYITTSSSGLNGSSKSTAVWHFQRWKTRASSTTSPTRRILEVTRTKGCVKMCSFMPIEQEKEQDLVSKLFFLLHLLGDPATCMHTLKILWPLSSILAPEDILCTAEYVDNFISTEIHRDHKTSLLEHIERAGPAVPLFGVVQHDSQV